MTATPLPPVGYEGPPAGEPASDGPPAMTLRFARAALAAALRRARGLGLAQSVAVVDAGGHPVAFARMDGAPFGSSALALDKAFTAAALGRPTGDLAEVALPGGGAFGLAGALGGRAVVFPGGVPVRRGGRVVGAIGVSGASGDQDADVARSAAAESAR